MRGIRLILAGLLIVPVVTFAAPVQVSSGECKNLMQQQQVRFINQKTVQSLFEAENAHLAPSKFAEFFAKDYQIIDVGNSDVPKAKAGDIVSRIAAFQKAHPNYKVKILDVLSDNDKVFVHFIVTKKAKTVLNSFTIFTLKSGKITKVVELVKQYGG